jgi:hypothetical protein
MTFFGMALLAAAGTIVLAVFAIVTAVYARKAFLKQSQEVAAIERQVADGRELTQQQAKLIEIQMGQLEALRGQLDEQRKASGAQADVRRLQAEELQESLKERKRQAELGRGYQARRVFLTEVPFAGRTGGQGGGGIRGIGTKPPSVTATAHNTSDQPIYDAELYWRRGSAGHGNPNPEPVGTLLPGATYTSTRDFPPGTNLEVSGAVLHFRDAAETKWTRRPDGYLGEQQS